MSNGDLDSTVSSQAGAAPSGKTVSLTRHYMRYLNANLLVLLAGAVSLPIMTRKLSTSDFGIFGYFETMALIWIALLKMGSEKSIIRFYPALCQGRSLPERRAFYASFVAVPGIVATFVSVVALAGLWGWSQWRPVENIQYLYIMLLISMTSVVSSLFENVLRAREMSGLSALLAIATRYLQLGLVVATLYWISATAMGVYVARLITCVVSVLLLLWWGTRNCDLSVSSFDCSLFRQSLAFGIPLLLSEIALVLHSFADQLMLKHIMGDFESVGIYRIGYAFAMYIGIFTNTSFYQAFGPVANRIYETQGAEAVSRVKRQILRLLVYVVVALGVGLVCVGRDFLFWLTGKDNELMAWVFVMVGINYALQPLLNVSAYGLTLLKRSKSISASLVGSMLLNLLLNWIMIPRIGIKGAVWATLISFFVMAVSQLIMCPASLRTLPGFNMLCGPVVLGALLWGVAHWSNLFGVQAYPLRVLVMVGLFVAVYVAPALALDRPLRRQVIERLGPILRRLGVMK